MNSGNADNPERVKFQIFWINTLLFHVKYQSLFRKPERIIRGLAYMQFVIFGSVTSSVKSSNINIQL